MERRPEEGYREGMDEKVERYMSKRNRRIKRRWAAGILSAVLVLSIGWNCLFDDASWFQFLDVNAYQGGTIEILEDPEVPLSSVPVIKEGGENASPGDDQGSEGTDGLVAFPDYEVQGSISEGDGQEPEYQAPEVPVRQMSSLETEIVREGGAYAQVTQGNTPIYTTSLLTDWFAMVDVGIVYASYYYVTDGMPDAVQVTFNSDYGIVMGYMHAGDLELLDRESTVRLLVDVSQVSTYFDAERHVPLAWVWYVPKDAENIQQETQQNHENNQVVVDWQEEDYNPESILTIIEEIQPEDDTAQLDVADTDDNTLTSSIIEDIDAENAADPTPTGLVDVNSVLSGIVPGMTVAESTETETAGQETETEEEPTAEETAEISEITEEATTQPSGDKVVDSANVLNSLIPGLSALETNNTSTEENENTEEPASDEAEEETEPVTDETAQESNMGSDKTGSMGVLANLIPGLAAMEENQSADADATEEETGEAGEPEATEDEIGEPEENEADEPEETEGEPGESEEDEAGEPEETEGEPGEPEENEETEPEEDEAGEPEETENEPGELEEDEATEPDEIEDEPGEETDASDETDLDEGETDEGSEVPEASIPVFEATEPANVPEYYLVGENGVYSFTDLSETAHYRVHGTIHGENEGFYVSDAQGSVGEPAIQADLAADLALVTPAEQETEGEDEQDTDDTAEETPDEEDEQAETVQFDATVPATEAMPAYYQDGGLGLYTFTDPHDIAHYRVHGYVNGDVQTEGFYVADAEGSLAIPAQLVDFAAEAQLLDEEEEVLEETIEDETPIEEVVFAAAAVPEGLLPAYYTEAGEGVYTFVGRDEAEYFRVYGVLNEDLETEGFYASDALGQIGDPAQKIDLAVEAEELAPQAEPEAPEETPEPTLAFTAAEPAEDLVPAFYTRLENGIFTFTAYDGQAYYRAYGYIGEASDWTAFYAAQDESGELVYPAVVIDAAGDAALMEAPEAIPAFERMEAPAENIPAFYTSFEDAEGLVAYAFSEFAGAQHYRVYGAIEEKGEAGFFVADEQGAAAIPYVLVDVAADEALVLTPVYSFAYTAPQQEAIPAYYAQNSAENPVYSFTGRDEATVYARIHGLVNGEMEGFYASGEDGTLIEPPQWIDLAEEAANLAPVADTTEFVHTLADAQIIPEFYEEGALDSGDALFSFADREDVTHYRVHGLVSGGAEGFYAAGADGGLIAPYVPVNTEDDQKLTQDIPVFMPKAAPADMPYYYTTTKQAEEAGASYDAMLNDEGEAESEGFSLGSIFGFLFATAYADELEVFSFIDRNGEWQYRVYGVVGDLEGWFVADEFGNPADLSTVVDLAEEIALMTTTTPLISARGLYNFAYTPVTPATVPQYYKIFHAGKSSIIYGFEGRPDDNGNVGDMYYRVYVDPNDGGEVGFYECDRYGENLGNKVDLQDEDLTLAPYRYQGVIFSGTLPNSDYKRAPDSIATYAYQYPDQDGNTQYRQYAYIVNRTYATEPPRYWLAISGDVGMVGEVMYVVKDINLDSDNLWIKGFIEREVTLDSATVAVPDYYGLATAVNNDDTVRARAKMWSFVNRSGDAQYRVYGTIAGVNGDQPAFYPCDKDGNVKRGAQPIDLVTELRDESPLQNGIAPVYIPGVAFVTKAEVTDVKDGVGTIDTQDKGIGYDTSYTNGIVRSYDGVVYTITYTTGVPDATNVIRGFKDAKLYIRAELPVANEKDAQFDLASMAWLEEPNQVFEGGKWILTGYRDLSSILTNDIAVPNGGSLVVSVQVFGMSQHSDAKPSYVEPTFTVWLDDGNANQAREHVAKNTDGALETVTGKPTKVTVTAGPFYNARLKDNRFIHLTGMFGYSANSGSFPGTDVYGRLIQVVVTLELDNGDASRGMMGVELPVGEIEVEFSMQLRQQPGSATTDNFVNRTYEHSPTIWDYWSAERRTTGVGRVGRSLMTQYYGEGAYFPTQTAPYNSGGATSRGSDAIYQGGTWTFEQTGWPTQGDPDTKATFKAKVSGYDFDNVFPTTAYGGNMSFSASRGVFSVGMVDFLLRPDMRIYGGEAWRERADCTYAFEITSFRATSKTGDVITEQTDAHLPKASGKNEQLYVLGESNDDYFRNFYTIYPPGNYSKAQYIAKTLGGFSDMQTNYDVLDARATPGTRFALTSVAHMGGRRFNDRDIGAFNLLQKFDPKVYYAESGGQAWLITEGSMESFANYQVYYGGVTGFPSDDSLKAYEEKDFAWFSSPEAVRAAGYNCAAILYEVRGAHFDKAYSYEVRFANNMKMPTKTDIGETNMPNIGYVGMTVNTLKLWDTSKGLGYGQSGSNGTLPDPQIRIATQSGPKSGAGYTEWENYHEDYTKTSYDSGGVPNAASGGHLFGNSLLVVGEIVTVQKTIAQKNVLNDTKTVFDMNKYENRVDYMVTATHTLQLQGGTNQGAQLSDVVITDTLPQYVEYIDVADGGGSYYGGTHHQDPDNNQITWIEGGTPFPADRVSVVKNGDGTTTITWRFPQHNPGDEIPPIYFSAYMGDPNDPTINPKHNTGVTNRVEIDSQFNASIKGKHEFGLTVTNLQDIKVYKDVQEDVIELGGTIHYDLVILNNAPNSMDLINVLDVLPFGTDARRGSDFEGGFTLKSITIKQTSTNGGKFDIKVSTDPNKKTENKNVNTNDFPAALGTFDGNAKGKEQTFNVNVKDATAILLTGNLKDFARFEVTLELETYGNEAGDLYVNDASIDLDINGTRELIVSAPVQTVVVDRGVSGLVWHDVNENGRREDSEKLIPGVKVSLEKKNETTGAYEKVTHNVLGQAYGGVGYYITGTDGFFEFKAVPSGDFRIVLENADPLSDGFDMATFELTQKHAAIASSTRNSDAEVLASDNDGKLKQLFIEFSMPEKDDMTMRSHMLTNLDTGLFSGLTIIKSATPEGDTGILLTEGDIIDYVITVNYPERGVRKSEISDVVPDGLTVVADSIWYKLADGIEKRVTDNAYSYVTKTIYWPEVDLQHGVNEFGFSAMVNKLARPVDSFDIPGMTYVNQGMITSRDPKKEDTTNKVTHESIGRSIELHKTAALIAVDDDNDIDEPRRGESNAPVPTDLNQKVEYRLTLTNHGTTSGEIEVTDNIPRDMKYVEGTMNATFIAGASGSTGSVVTAKTEYVEATGTAPAYVKWTVTGMAPGEQAELRFWAQMPKTADDPLTEDIVEIERIFVNKATAIDVYMRDKTYGVDNGEHGADDKIWPDEEDWTVESEETYHRITEPIPIAYKTSDKQKPGAFGDDPSGLTIVPNKGKDSQIEYTITLENNSTGSTLLGARIRDYIPEGTRLVSVGEITKPERTVVELNDESDAAKPRLTWTIDKLSPGEAVKVRFTVEVLDNPNGAVLIENKAYYDRTNPTGDLDEDPPEETNTLENPVLWHTKLSSPTGVLREGQRVTYLIHVEVPDVNGDWPLVTVADTVPNGTTYVRNSIHIDDVLQSDSKYSNGSISFIANEPLAPGRHVFRFSVVVGKLPEGVNQMEIRNAALINGDPTTEVKQDVKSRYADITKKSRLIDFDGTELEYNNGGPSFAERVTAEFGQEIEYHLTVTAKGATGLEGADLIVTDVIPNLTQVSDTDFEPVITSGSAATVSGPSVLTNAQGQPYITWTIKNLKVGESVELTFRVRVDAQLPEGESVGLIDNVAKLLDKLIEQHTYESTVYDENGDIIHHEGSKVYTQEEIDRESNMTHHKVIDPDRDVVFVKTADPLSETTVQPGDIITYFLTAEVVGGPITGVTLTDTLPDGVHYVENSMVLTHTALDWTVTTTPIDDADGYDPATHTIELTGLTLERGTTELSYQVLVGKLPEGTSQMTIRNHAVYDDGETREEKYSEHTIITRYAEIRKTAALVEGEYPSGLGGSMPHGEENGIPDPVDTEKGQVVEYHIYVKNVSDGGLTSGKIVVTDRVPEYTTLVPGSITAEIPAKSTFSVTGDVITWELFNLNPGEEMLLTFRVWAPTTIPDGTFSLIFRNIAEMTDVERKEETYKETVRVYDRDGNVTEYTSGSVIYEDTEVTKQSEETQHIIREANVVGEKDSDKSIPGTNMGYTVKVGDTIRYTIRVTNDGAKAAENVRIRDTIPTGTEYVAGSGMIGNVPGGAFNGAANHITFDIPRIEVGQTIQVFFTVEVVDIHNGAGDLITIVNQAFYDKDINLDDPSDEPKKPTEEVKNPTMEFEKSSNAGAYVKEGQAIDYTIAVKASANLAERKTIRDILPEGVMLDRESIYMQLQGEAPVKLDAMAHYDPATRTITWPDVVLKAGENLFTYTVVVAPLPAGVLERQLKNTAQTTGGGWEEEIVTVKRRYADIWKEAQLIPLTGIDEGGLIANGTPENPVQTAPGQRVEYTLRVENISATGLVSGDIIIYDPIPEHTTYVTGSMTTPVFSAGGTGTMVSMDDSTGTPTWVVTGMSPGETVDVKFRVIAPTPPVDGSITFINSGWLTDEEVRDTTYDRTIFDENGNEIATGTETVREKEEYEVESNKTYHIVEDTPVRIVKGSTPSDGSVVREGQKIDYTILVYVEDRGQSRVLQVSDTIRDGLILLEDTVSPATFTYENRVLTWDAAELEVGENKFTFSAIVERLEEDVFEKDLGNIAVVKDPSDPNDPGKPSNEVKHTVKRRYAELEKTAALVTKYGTDGLHGILDPRDDGRDEPVVTKIGQVVEYIITVTNRGSLASKEIDVWDVIPTGTTLVPGSISHGGTLTGSRIDWTFTMLPGETRELTFRVWAPETTDDPATPGYETERHFYNKANLKDWELTQIQYEATFVDDEGTEYKVNETVYKQTEYELETEETHHVVYEPLIDMVKTSDRMRQNTPSVTGQLVFPGDEITYTLAVANNGSKVAEDVMIRDYIPEGTTFKEVLDNYGGQLYTLGTRQHVTWVIDSLDEGETIELRFVVTVDELANGPILIRNAGLYDPHPEEPGDPDPEDPGKPPVDPEDPVDPPEETPEVTNPTLIIEKTAVPVDGTQLTEGDAIAYTITVTVSEGDAQGVTISDPLPDGVYFVPGSIKYKLGTSPELPLADSAYDLGTHTVTWLRNNRPLDLPAGVSTFKVEAVVAKLGNDADGNPILEKDLVNHAMIKTQEREDPPIDPPTVTHTVKGRYASIDKTAALIIGNSADGLGGTRLGFDPGDINDPVDTEFGQVVEYHITVANHGDLQSDRITVRDMIPEHTTLVPDSISHNGTVQNGEIVWVINRLAVEGEAGDSVTLIFRIWAPEGLDGEATRRLVFENQATLTDRAKQIEIYEKDYIDENGEHHSERDAVYTEEEYTADSPITYHEVSKPKLSLTKTAEPSGDVKEGQVIKYTITVTVENKKAEGIDVIDWIPHGVVLLEDTVTSSIAGLGHTYNRHAGNNQSERQLKWDPTDMEVGEHTFTYEVVVRKLDEGVTYLELNNAATVTDPYKEPGEEDPKVVITNTVRSRYSSIVKNAALLENGVALDRDPGTLANPVQTGPGQTVEYYLTVTNITEGGIRSGLISVTDVLPVGTEYVEDSMSAVGSDPRIVSADYDDATRTLTWEIEDLGIEDPDNAIELVFQVTAPESAMIFENQAILVDEDLTEIEYEKTFTDEDGKEFTEGGTVYEREEVTRPSNETYHEVKMPEVSLIKTASPSGDVREGQVIHYTITVTVENGTASGIEVTDWIPAGVTLLEDTVETSVQNVQHSYDRAAGANGDERLLKWGPMDLAVGDHTFEYDVIVRALPEGVTYLELNNAASVTNPNGEDPKVIITNIVRSRYAEIEKNAALITDGEPEDKDPGTITNPVQTDAGQTVEYYLTVRNVTDADLESGEITVTDVLPEDTSYVDGSMTPESADARIKSSSYNPATRTLTWVLDGLGVAAPESEIVLTFRVVAPTVDSLFINKATIIDEELKIIEYEKTFTDEEGNEWTEGETVRETEEIEKDSNETFHEVKIPVVSLEKSASHEEVREGQIITYTVRVEVENAPLKGYTLTDTIPDGVTLLESTVNPAAASYNKDKTSESYKQLVWGPQDLAIGEYTYEYKVIVNPLPEGVTRLEIRNAVVIGSTTPPWEPENPPKSETVTIVKSRYAEIVKNAALVTDGELEEKDPGTAANPVQTDPGQTVEYYLTVRNVSDTGLSSGKIIVTDVLPEGATYVPGTMSVPGDDARILRAEYEAATRTLHWELDNLAADAPGDEITLVFRVTAPRHAQIFINQAVLEDEELKEITHETTYTDEDGNEWTENETVRETEEIEKESNETFHEVKEPIVTLEKSASHEEVREGQIITYTVNVTVEDAPLKGYTLTDTIPDGVTLLESTVNPAPASYNKDKASANYKQLVWGPEDLAIGEYTYEYKVIVNPLPEGVTRLTIRNAVVIGSTNPPWEPENPPKSETETTVKSRYAEIEKNAALITDGEPEEKDPGTAANPVDTDPGQTVEYYLTVRNVSDTGLSSGKIIVTDVLPEGTTYVSGSMSVAGSDIRIVDAQYDAATRTLRWELDGLTAAAPGNEITLVFRVTAPTSAQLFVNKALLEDEELKEITHETTYTDEDGNEWTENETVRETDEVEKESNETFHEVKAPKVTVTKEASRSEAKEGQIVTYTVRVKIEDAMVKGYTLTDTVPAGVTLLESTVRPAHTSYSKDKNSADYHKLVWGPEDKATGEYTYTYQVVVNPLPEGVTKLELRNLVVVGSTNPPWEPENPPKSETVTTVKSRYAEISKNAALVTNGVAGGKNPGTAANPVGTAAQQTVEYYLTVKNVSEAGMSSGRIVVTDVLPAGTTYVAGSMSAVGTDTRIAEAAYDSATRTLRWVLSGLSATAPGNEITLVFRITAPASAQIFVNKAELEDEERKETTTETTYTDEDGKTWTEGETVVDTDDVTKESNPTYHEVVATVTPTPTPTPTPVITARPTSTATTQPGTGGGGGGGGGATPTASPTASPTVIPGTDPTPTPSPAPTSTPRPMPEMPEDPEGRTPSNVRTYYNIDDIETPLAAGENMNLGDCFD